MLTWRSRSRFGTVALVAACSANQGPLSPPGAPATAASPSTASSTGARDPTVATMTGLPARPSSADAGAQRMRASVEGGASGANASPEPPSAAPDEKRAPCTEFDAPVVLGAVQNLDLREISGVVASRSQPGVLYVHNDSGDKPRFFALNPQGGLLGAFLLKGASAVDWEDIAIGPGSGSSGGALYLGDIGDNAAREGRVGRSSIEIYRVDEPTVDLRHLLPEILVERWQSVRLTYPDHAHDAEAMFVEPTSGDLYLITKELLGPAVVFRLAAPLPFGGAAKLERLAGLDLPGWGPFRMVTAADISPSGRSILVRTYAQVFLWVRQDGQSIAEALHTRPITVPAPIEPQGEAIAFAHDAGGYFTLSEGVRPRVHFVRARCPRPL